MHLIVALVPPVVLRAGKTCAKQAEHSKHHIGSLLLIDEAELLKVDLLSLTEAQVQYDCHLFEGVNAFFKSSGTASFLSELSLGIDLGPTTDDWHASNYCCDIRSGDVLVAIEVVDVEHKFHLLIKLGAVDTEEASQELFRV